MKPSPACTAIVKQFEGYAREIKDGRCTAYPDPASGGDPWTIGFGSTGPDVRCGVIWTRAKAEERLEYDLEQFAKGVEAALGGALTTQCQFDAMVSLAYNIGLKNFRNSTLLKKHRARDFNGATTEFLRWNRAAGKVMDGLTRRRAAEAALYRSDGKDMA